MVLQILLLCFIWLQIVLGSNFIPHKVSFEGLVGRDEITKNVLNDGLENVGLITVTNIPKFEELREDVLSAATECALYTKNRNSGESLSSVLADGTTRFTIAGETLEGERDELMGADFSYSSCQEFAQLEKEFRDLVDEVMAEFVMTVDDLMGANGNSRKLSLLKDSAKNTLASSLTEVVESGVQLEHFHTYEKNTRNIFSFDHALDVHTDAGIFIAMTPALSLNTYDQRNHGLLLKLKNGDIVEPDFGDNNELIFMLGSGFQEWVNPKAGLNFRAAPHAVVMPRTHHGLSLRSWYGKMVLPPHEAFLEPQGMTFRQLRETMSSGDKSVQAAGFKAACSTDFVTAARNLQADCSDNQIFCWMQCRDAPTCNDNEVLGCGVDDGETIETCVPDITNPACLPACFPETVDTGGDATIENDFCANFGVTMFMQGFQGPRTGNNGCLTFLFQGWLLDTPGKYVLAVGFSFFLGVVIEFIVKLRRDVTTSSSAQHRQTPKILLYSAQVSLAYIAMLIAMTYSIVLFISVVTGLTVGHRVFNFSVVPTENNDHCCPSPEQVEKKITVGDAVKQGVAQETTL